MDKYTNLWHYNSAMLMHYKAEVLINNLIKRTQGAGVMHCITFQIQENGQTYKYKYRFHVVQLYSKWNVKHKGNMLL